MGVGTVNSISGNVFHLLLETLQASYILIATLFQDLM